MWGAWDDKWSVLSAQPRYDHNNSMQIMYGTVRVLPPHLVPKGSLPEFQSGVACLLASTCPCQPCQVTHWQRRLYCTSSIVELTDGMPPVGWSNCPPHHRVVPGGAVYSTGIHCCKSAVPSTVPALTSNDGWAWSRRPPTDLPACLVLQSFLFELAGWHATVSTSQIVV